MIWIDIDNPPQAQYLPAFKYYFESTGRHVVITARDYGATLDLLQAKGIAYTAVSRRFGKSSFEKIRGTLIRALKLFWLMKKDKPEFLISSSRSSALAAYLLGIPSFILCDYEHVDLSIYRFVNSFLVYPDVIAAQSFMDKGFAKDRLIAYPGLKEDLTFSYMDIDKAVPAVIDNTKGNYCLALYRPPSEESHYYQETSGSLSEELLSYLSLRADARLVFTPRMKGQIGHLRKFQWVNDPIILDKAVDALSLFSAVDLVICSGGTMLREAAYFGIPAYSIFQNEKGMVDSRLESNGKVIFIKSKDDFSKIKMVRRNNMGLHAPENGKQVTKDLCEKIIEKRRNLG